MTTYRDLLEATGLSLRGAARFHGVSYPTIKNWSSGRRPAPSGVLDELERLIQAIDNIKK